MKTSPFRLLPVLFLIPSLAFSASVAGKVRAALGECERQKAKQVKWSPLVVGASIFQTDRLRTGAESEIIFGLPDGSTVSIAENAEVEIERLLEPDGKGSFDTRLNVEDGFVKFAIKKQKKQSKFRFKTGVHTASIRGTDGFVGGGENFFASLSTGKLDVQTGEDGPASSIGAGETIFGKDSLVTLKLASSGNPKLARRLVAIMKSGKALDEMVKDVKAADASVQEEMKKAAVESLPENGFTLDAESAEVCEAGLTVSGNYRTADPNAKLVVKLGKTFTSSNLVAVADGAPHAFVQNIPVNDANGLWTETEAQVVFTSAKAKDTKKVAVGVNASCAGVNLVAPQIQFVSYDSVACKARLSVGGMQGDEALLALSVDGSATSEETVSKNGQKTVKLVPGVHEYVYTATDLAKNVATAKKSMGCYPVQRFVVEVFGEPNENLLVPPPPMGIADRIGKTLQFKIKNPENDPQFLYRVTVRQNGKVILQETLSQIQSLDYDIPVELVRGAKNKFDIEVIHKSGFKAKAVKRFEVR